MSRFRRGAIWIAIALAGCALAATLFAPFRFAPDPTGDAEFIARAQHRSGAGVKVSVSALGPVESRRSFGEDLAKYEIQPLWISIDNDTDDQLTFLPIATDPAYYSPYEVSYRFRGAFSDAENRARDAFFLERQMPSVLPPRARTTGFIYGVLDAGVKYARIQILRNDRLDDFNFVLPVPGAHFLGTQVRAETLYPGRTLGQVDIDGLRSLLARYPCCTSDATGERKGDPVNLVIVESRSDPIQPFIARGWHMTQTLDVASMIETARAFVFRDQYQTSPVSPLYMFGRKEDLALQKARSTINERLHLRLWLMPETFESRRIWIGQVSRDIGVRLTDKAWNLTTHKIGPDVDFDRDYLLQDLLESGFVDQFGFVEGVGRASMSAPRANLTGDPYFTDGLRLVVFLSNSSTPLTRAARLQWSSQGTSVGR